MRCLQRSLDFAIPTGRKDARPLGERGERLDPQINPGLLTRGRKRLDRYIGTAEADLPPIGLAADGDRLGRSLQRARAADGNAPILDRIRKPLSSVAPLPYCL